MAITIDWGNKIINVPKNYLTLVSGTLYELDTDQFRLSLKSLEDDEAGMVFLDTHRHNTAVTVAGVTYARFIEIINGYSVTFEDGQYSVRLSGSNNNIFDVENGILNQNQVQVIPGNSAGLVAINTGSGLSTEEHDQLMALEALTTVAVFAKLMSGSLGRTFEQVMEAVASALAGKSTGGGTANIKFRNFADDTDVIDATVDANGNRTAVTLDV